MVKQTYQYVHSGYSEAFFQFLQFYYSIWERFFLQHITPGAAFRRHLIHRNRILHCILLSQWEKVFLSL